MLDIHYEKASDESPMWHPLECPQCHNRVEFTKHALEMNTAHFVIPTRDRPLLVPDDDAAYGREQFSNDPVNHAILCDQCGAIVAERQVTMTVGEWTYPTPVSSTK